MPQTPLYTQDKLIPTTVSTVQRRFLELLNWKLCAIVSQLCLWWQRAQGREQLWMKGAALRLGHMHSVEGMGSHVGTYSNTNQRASSKKNTKKCLLEKLMDFWTGFFSKWAELHHSLHVSDFLRFGAKKLSAYKCTRKNVDTLLPDHKCMLFGSSGHKNQISKNETNEQNTIISRSYICI